MIFMYISYISALSVFRTKQKAIKTSAICRGVTFPSPQKPARKITDLKTDEDATRPFWNKYKKYRRRPCRKCPTPPEPPACPYNFTKPLCVDAEPQTPRDLSTENGAIAEGFKTPKAAVLTPEQAEFIPLVNIHFHLGAEHKSNSYNNGTHSEAYDGGAKDFQVRPGWMCPISDLNQSQLEPYSFQHCLGPDVLVGKSYEIHYVHSTAGVDANPEDDSNSDDLSDGLGGAANGRNQLNPMIVVEALIVHIVQGAPARDLFNGWDSVNHDNSVIYSGSTTGTSHDNVKCSPYVITWHVNRECIQVPPESFDELCRVLKVEYNKTVDIAPQGSRILVDPQYVVNSTYVYPYV